MAAMGVRVGHDEAVAHGPGGAERCERRPVEPGRAAHGRVRLAEAREMDDASDRPRVLEDADAHAPRGEPGHEGGRAVDRVEDDAVGSPALTRRALLAQDAGVGEERAQLGDQRRLDLAVGGRHQRAVRLPLGRHAAEVRERQRTGACGDRLELGARGKRHASPLVRPLALGQSRGAHVRRAVQRPRPVAGRGD